MNRRGKGLQLVVLAPVLVLNMVAGGVLYMLVLWTVGDYADESISSNLNSLARSAFAVADVQEDRRNREGKSKLIYQMYARVSFEDFAREHDIGLIIEDGGAVDSERLDKAVVDAIRQETSAAGHSRVRIPGGSDYYVQTRYFEPWNWRLILVKDASAFEAVVGRVRAIYVGSAVLLLLVTLGLLVWLRQVLVRPIYRIAGEFREGRAPDYKGVGEIEFLSDSIGEMMRSLQAKTLHLETALESMSDAITVFDPEMNLVAWNEQFVHLYRYPHGFIRDGLSFEDIMRYNVERGDYGDVEPETTLARLIKRARNLDPPRFEVDRADGTSIEIRRARMPYGGFVTTYSDITDRRNAETVEVAKQKAEEMAALKSSFFNIVSHELRGPIGAVISYLRRVVRKTEGQLPERQAENLRRALANCNRLLELTNDLLDLAKLEYGGMDIHVTEFPLGGIMKKCVHMIEPVVRDKRLNLSIRVDNGLTMFSDADHVEKILSNLLTNAVKFTETGAIDIVASSQDENAVITVSDTGIGIAPQYLESIFDEFEQGGRQPGGTGLGLPISRQFARLLGGDVTVESKVGEGSTFTATAPLRYEAAAEEEAAE